MPATDDYASYIVPPGSCRNAAAVTPSDTADLTNVSRYLIAGASGTISVITEAGQSVVITVAAGFPFPIAVSRVKATGTTATGITALW